MAHFAEIDSTYVVQRVVVISNDDLLDTNGVEQESLGVQVCQSIFGANTNWVQTSYNGNFRKKYAGIGDIYVPEADLFYTPVALFPSWALDDNYDWQPPVERPTDGKDYYWDEESLSWVEVVGE